MHFQRSFKEKLLTADVRKFHTPTNLFQNISYRNKIIQIISIPQHYYSHFLYDCSPRHRNIHPKWGNSSVNKFCLQIANPLRNPFWKTLVFSHADYFNSRAFGVLADGWCWMTFWMTLYNGCRRRRRRCRRRAPPHTLGKPGQNLFLELYCPRTKAWGAVTTFISQLRLSFTTSAITGIKSIIRVLYLYRIVKYNGFIYIL